MSKNYVELYYHFVWSTWRRSPFMVEEVQQPLYRYLMSVSCTHLFKLFAVNGIEDHIHVVASIPPKISISQAVKLLKGSSAHFCNHVLSLDFVFKWQRGYAALTFGKSALPNVVSYVQNQKRHHANNHLRPNLETQTFDEDK